MSYALAVVFASGDVGHRLLDGLKLFPQFPGVDKGKRWEYILARQLAALALLAVTIGVVAALLSERIAELRARFRRNHAVVCGLGETGLRNVLAFRERGVKTTCVELSAKGDAVDAANAAGALVLHRDATQVSTLEIARVDRAEWIVCSCNDDATNSRIASLVVELAAPNVKNYSPKVEVHIDNPHLARVLRGPLARVGAVQLHFFNSAHVWARALVDAAATDGSAPRLAVLGAGSLGSAVVVEAARRWHGVARAASSDERASIRVFGPDASELKERVCRRYPALQRVADVHSVDEDLLPGGPLELGEAPLDAVFACVEDESVNFAVALEAERTTAERVPVLLPATAAVTALAPLLTGVGAIQTVELAPAKTSLDLLHDQTTDLIARSVHEAYLAQRRSETDFGTRPADKPWSDLASDDVHSNRAHAEGIIEQLRAVWFEIEQLYDWDQSPEVLDPFAIEAMSELEHARWCREKVDAGWRYGPVRDDAAKVHNLLVPWEKLDAKERRLDRALVANRPALLSAAGLRVVRDPSREELARALHEDYVAASDGEPSAVPWEQLPEAKRESNRRAVDHIPVKLARIHCRIVPQGRGIAERFVLTAHEIEELAQLEYARWAEERSNGPVPEWRELSAREQEKNRAIVRSIPDQLLAVGYGVVRDAR